MCGIIGVYGAPLAAYEAYRGLLTLQHRGQDAAGILAYNFQTRQLNLEKELGHVSKVFTKKKIAKLSGSMAIGHTRYSTIGDSESSDLQPMVFSHPHGLGMVHNGNLVNYFELEEKMRTTYQTQTLSKNDLEMIHNIFARSLEKELRERANDDTEMRIQHLIPSVQKIFDEVKGGYSVIASVAGFGLLAFRDPNGIRPLVLGRRELSPEEQAQNQTAHRYSYMLASESMALQFMNYTILRDVKPGELIYIDRQGEFHNVQVVPEAARHCMFEWVYFSSPESQIEGRSVYRSRLKLGEILANKVQNYREQGELPVDMVVPIPETSRIAAIGMSERLGLPYREVLIKNRYIQRSFILNTQEERENAVKLKLSPVTSEIRGKDVLLVDDSIVRGTTSKNIVQMVRRAGARRVYFAVTCAPIRFPCYFGIDFPDSNELVAYQRTEAEVAASIGADKVIYLSETEIAQAIGTEKLCMACLNGEYPVNIQSGSDFLVQRKRRLGFLDGAFEQQGVIQ